MATVSSNINPNPYVIPQTNVDPNPSLTAFNKGVDRNDYQHRLVSLSKGGVGVAGGGGGSGTSTKTKMKKNKKMRMSKRMSRMSSRRRFSRKFRKSLKLSSRKNMLRGARRNKHKNKKLSRGGAGTMTIPSFSQTTPNGTAIINQLASNHAQTLAYSSFDGDVKPPGAPST
jgi:hypothetical protein